jgi:hypothetical protein
VGELKRDIPKLAAVGALVLVVVLAVAFGGMAVNRTAGPEIDRTPPPADFMDPSKAPKR